MFYFAFYLSLSLNTFQNLQTFDNDTISYYEEEHKGTMKKYFVDTKIAFDFKAYINYFILLSVKLGH